MLYVSILLQRFVFVCAHTPRSIVALSAAGRYSPIPQKEVRIFGASSLLTAQFLVVLLHCEGRISGSFSPPQKCGLSSSYLL